MTRILFTFGVCTLTACNNPVSRNESVLAKKISTFLVSGQYDVQIVNAGSKDTLREPQQARLAVTNNLGVIEFEGKDSFIDLDSIKISLNDSTLSRQFSVNHFIDTISVSETENGFSEDYFGYAFGERNSGGILNIPEFRHLFSEDEISGSQALFIVGRTKENNNIVIRQIERIVSSEKILLDVNKAFILTRNFQEY